nr:MAG TPA: hypothetical protein [Bacteriophage sp.]
MASYSIVSNARFRPFSYDELVKPLIQYKEAYDKAEADYTNLAMQTEAWRDIANQENSPVAYKMYKTYSDDLSRMVDDFSKGMTLSNRGALMGLKRRYASEITPIARASEAFDKAEAFRADIRAKNPNAVFEVDRYNSIDDFLGGRRPNNAYWDGDSTLKRVAAKAEALGRSLYSNPTAKLFLNGQQYQISQLNGISPEELTQILLHPENINTEAGRQMRKIMDDELSSIDLSKYSLEGQSKINNIIATGMYAGLAKPTYNYVANGEYMSRAERDASSARWASIKLDRDKFDYAKLQDKISTGQEPYYTDTAGNKYYRTGDAYWTVDKNGNRSAIRYTKKTYDESGNSAGGSPQSSKAKDKFSYKDFVMDSDTFEGGGGFSVSDAEPAEVSSLNDYQRGELNKYLRENGLTLEDVSLYIDRDTFSNDHVRVVLKGADIYGVPSNAPSIDSDENAGSVGGL